MDAVTENSKIPEGLGKYRIEGVLGEGAMGIVYKGYDASIDRYVALKTVHKSLLRESDHCEWLNRFQQEAKAVGRCLHQNIVAVFDYGEDQGIPYIALEYVDGKSLRELLNLEVLLSPDTIISIVSQVLNGLQSAHASGVVHRDIKPANIMVLQNGQIKVTDFGVAHLDTSELTQTGMMIGTPSYMAPEQFKGQKVSHLTDIYACGVMLYELLAGRKPFMGRNSSEIMYKILQTEPDFDIPQLQVPPMFRHVLGKALAKEPGERFQTAREFIAALAHCRQDSEPETIVATAPGTPAASAMGSFERPRANAAASEMAMSSDESALRTYNGMSLEPVVLAALERELTTYVGPIAKVLIKKSAKKVASPQELCRQLAQHIPDKSEQSAFLQAVKVQL